MHCCTLTMSTHDSKNGLSNQGRPRLEVVSPRFNGEESVLSSVYTLYTRSQPSDLLNQ
jgi:hypothetical protein